MELVSSSTMKAVSAQAESCCVYVKPTKNYVTHAWQNSMELVSRSTMKAVSAQAESCCVYV